MARSSLFLVAALLGGAGSITAITTACGDDDSPTTPTNEAGAGDETSSGSSGNNGEAGSDANDPDATDGSSSGNVDGGQDSSKPPPPLGDGGTASFCADEQAIKPFVFCDDYNQGGRTNPQQGWTSTKTDPTATFSVASAPGGSAALHAVVATGTASRQAWLEKDFAQNSLDSATKFTVKFKMLIATNSLDFARIGSFILTGVDNAVGYTERSSVSIFGTQVDGETEFKGAPQLDVAVGTWINVEIVGTKATAASTTFDRKVFANGIEVESVTARKSLNVNSISLLLGAAGTSVNAGAIDVWYDDVILRIE